jgi:hypothetical protein
MRIITDTNIWYYLGEDNALFEKVKGEHLCPNHINIIELCRTENLIEKQELVRHSIQKMFFFKNNVIYEHPFANLAKLNGKYDFDVEKEMGEYLKFTEYFAKGATIDELKKSDFLKWVADKRAKKEEVSQMFNAKAEEINKQIKDKKKHRNEDTTQICGDFVNVCVKAATENKCNIEGIELGNIELLMVTLDTYFKNLELSPMRIEANDWNDLAILAYVRPGDLYWTEEKRWKNLIKQAGMEKYLYVLK